jgi:selenocysteine-specific elongation factor
MERDMAVIGTAGHIDHGKTALVKALTGVDTDRLPEEKARGITIDLGFAHANWQGTDVSFIDVPGHERFVRNMLAGIGGIDLLMLVVAADESVMPQTREHFDICRLLNIPAGIVVITKSDLVAREDLELVNEEIAEVVKGSFLENASSYAVSSATGSGIEELRTGILNELKQIKQRSTQGIFRLPVDRIFTLKGHGTVVTGTLIGGKVHKEDQVQILPAGIRTRIRSIHAHNEPVTEAVAGQRTSLNLQGIDKAQVVRGDVLTEPEFLESSSLLNAKITLLNSAKHLTHNALIRFHHLASDTLARVTLLGVDQLDPGQSAYAQIRLQKPVSALYGDHFIFRRQSPLITAGGGVILDHHPVKRIKKGDVRALERLKQLETASNLQRLEIVVEERSLQGASEKYLKSRMALSPEKIRELTSDKVLVLRKSPLLMISADAAKTVLTRIRTSLQLFHEKNSLLPGIPKEELRSRYLPSVPADVFQAILEHSASTGAIQLEKDLAALSGRTSSLTSQEEALANRIADEIRSAGLEFQGIGELASKIKQKIDHVTKIAYLLVRQGKVIKIADDYFVDREQWQDLKTKIRELKSSQKTFSVPDFKTRFGISRKYAIPLLEMLDREGITRRTGNERIII